MSLVKCDYCRERLPARQVPLHLKRCVYYRRLLKAGKIQPIDDAIEVPEVDGNTIEKKKIGKKKKPSPAKKR